MIFGVGVDLIEIRRIKKALINNKFREKIFTLVEQKYCEDRGQQKFASYAARFAAKEAVYKALSTKLHTLILKWTDIEVQIDVNGKPHVQLLGAILQWQISNCVIIHLSMTHTHEYAIAQVVCECG